MKRYKICLIILFLSLYVNFAAAENSEMEESATKAAKSWLSLVDSGKYGQSWNESAEYFRNAITKEQWVQSLKILRNPLGKVVTRKVKTADFKTSLPGAPDGKYVVVQFSTSFENKKNAIETVTPMLDKSGNWRVSGYYIK